MRSDDFEEFLNESFAGHVVAGRVAPRAFEFLKFCLLMHKGDLRGRWLWHRRERYVIQREGLHTGVYVEANSSARGGGVHFDHDVCRTKMYMVRSKNACGFEVNAVFTIGPFGERCK